VENFTELYKTFPTEKLVNILDDAHEFHISAVEAARREIESRQLTADQLAAARVVAEQHRESRLDVIGSRISTAGSAITNLLHPVQWKKASLEKYLQLLAVFLGLLAALYLYRTVRILGLLIEYDRRPDVTTAVEIVRTLIAIGAAGLLWRRYQIGWALAVLFFSHMASMAFLDAFRIIELTGNNPFSDLYFDEASLPFQMLLTQGGLMFLHGVSAVMLCRKATMQMFGLTSGDMITSIAAGIGLTLLIFFLV
jgi:hypothetical protein